MRYFDTHCHLGDEKIKPRVGEVLKNAETAGVEALCVICADPQNIEEFEAYIPSLRELASKEGLKIAIHNTSGLHPHEAQHWSSEIEESIERQLKGAVAVGETGLDYHYNFSEPAQQKKVFTRHIDWACEKTLPLVIHCREAADDILQLMDRADLLAHPRPGILHCFTESKEVARELLDRNFMISFSGIVTFKNAESLREVASFVPKDRLLIETDSPYLAPNPFRGRPNEPAYVKHTFDLICDLRKEQPEGLAEQLWKNSQHIYQVS